MEKLTSDLSPIDYSIYLHRLNTYAINMWPKSAPEFVKYLAEAGFVFTGKNDLVYCFECKIELSGWLEDHNPIQRHKDVNSNCPFIIQQSKKKLVNDDKNDDKLYNPNMKSEDKRYQSFGMCPPEKHWPSPEKLAKSGMYYDYSKKMMVCFCCGFMVDSWESAEQDPYVKHKSAESSCSFIKRVQNKDNFVEEKTTISNPNLIERFPSYKTEWTKPAILIDYSNEHTRLQTFFSYPRNSPVSADSLVKAGFYYLGRNDEVMCYKCSVSLKDFEIGDTAWGEHRRHSPACPLVKNYLNSNNSKNTYSGTSSFSNRVVGSVKECNESPIQNANFLRNLSADSSLSNFSSFESENLLNTGRKAYSESDLKSIQNLSHSIDLSCVICMDNNKEMIFLPCAHLIACSSCAKGQAFCPMCRSPIVSTLKTYMS
ncbi:E3 ubiquitin-protein ligase XIAP-like [Hydra vulgaris]|uniref:IAP protein n=1 Tax=Hydra vulgaris TaxID=6087 RepID=D1M869_HYDVU|nr:E3 ubiquitin-protein ligase XIAP-like [Hydra vulgaris]ACY71871.1 IAP protein [Hydra vulgaris]